MTPQERRAQRRIMREQERQAREARRHPDMRRAPQQRNDTIAQEQDDTNKMLDTILGQGNGPRLDTDGIRGSSTSGIENMLRTIAGAGPQTPIREVLTALSERLGNPEGQAWLQSQAVQQGELSQLRAQMGALAQQRQGRGFAPGWDQQQPAPPAQQGVPDPAAAQRQPQAAQQRPEYESVEGTPITPQTGNVVTERASPIPQWERPMLGDPPVRTQSNVPQWDRQMTPGVPERQRSTVPQWERPMR